MNRREFLRTAAAVPCAAVASVAGVVAVAPAIHTAGYIQSSLKFPIKKKTSYEVSWFNRQTGFVEKYRFSEPAA